MNETVDRFSQERKEWATARDALAARCYQEHFDVDAADIYSLEGLVESEHVIDDGYDVHQILDYGGVDRIIDCGDRHIYVAQRWRPNKKGKRDLSLRVDNGVAGRYAELDKWRNAHAGLGFYPSVIAFGIYDDLVEAFTEFYLIDTAALLDALAVGILSGERHWTGDGTEALYLPTGDLADAGCVIAQWEGVTLEDD